MREERSTMCVRTAVFPPPACSLPLRVLSLVQTRPLRFWPLIPPEALRSRPRSHVCRFACARVCASSCCRFRTCTCWAFVKQHFPGRNSARKCTRVHAFLPGLTPLDLATARLVARAICLCFCLH